MPPRYAYWTILAGGLPTSFRAADKDELLPTFRRIKERQPDAEMKYFARGKLWESAEEARRANAPPARFPDRPRPGAPRTDRERRGRDWRPGGDHRDPRQPFKDAKKARNQARRGERWARKPDRDRPRERPHGDPLAPRPERRDAGPRRPEAPKTGPRSHGGPTWGPRPHEGKGRRDAGGRKDWRDRPPAAKHGAPRRGGEPRRDLREPRAGEGQGRGSGGPKGNPPRHKPHGDVLRQGGPRREFQGSRDRRFERKQHPPPRPNREPPPGREPKPEPPPRPSEPSIKPPGPPERGEPPTSAGRADRRREE